MTNARAAAVDQLFRARERSWLLRGMLVGSVSLVAFAWLSGTIDFGDLFHERRVQNLRRFLTHDAVPPSVRSGSESVWAWAAARVGGRNGEALAMTVALATVAAALSGLVGLIASAWTARTVCAADDPFGSHASGARLSIRRGLGRLARLLCVLMRAVPEYLMAFLLGAFFQEPAVACLIALVVHNAGILGRLYGETLENLDPRPARAWYVAGASRGAAMVGAQLPAAFPRGLTYLFLRFETCVRESTVLGALGFVSLGYWIVQERAAGRYDEMLLLVAMGAGVVVLADVLSWAARTAIRRAR